MQRVKDMLGDLNPMLEADARGEHTQDDFERFMEQYGDLFPDNPQNLEELVDSLVRRMAAAERLLRSLSPEQREELAELMSNALEDAGLAIEMAPLADALRARRPDLDQAGQMGGVQMSGEEPLGLGDATTALAELADLAELENALGQDYPGATMDDIDEDAVRRAFGRQAVDDMRGPAPHRAGTRTPGLPDPQRRTSRAHAQGGAPAGRHGAAPDLRRHELRQPVRRPRPARRRAGRAS